MRRFRIKYKRKDGFWYAERWTWHGWGPVDVIKKQHLSGYGVEKIRIGHKHRDGALRAIENFKKAKLERAQRPKDCIEYVE